MTEYKPALHDATMLRNLYITRGHSTIAIAKQIGCSQSAVSKALRSLGIPTRPRHGHAKKPYNSVVAAHRKELREAVRAPLSAPTCKCSNPVNVDGDCFTCGKSIPLQERCAA